MANTKLNGKINLSRILKELIRTNNNGEKYIYVDVVKNYNDQVDQYGNTHNVQMRYKEGNTWKTLYIGNLKEVEFGAASTAQPAAPAETAPAPDPIETAADDDLPF